MNALCKLLARTAKLDAVERSSGAHMRIRTADPFLTMEVLYQLSYVGKSILL